MTDWSRWHDLLDIRDRRGFTSDEQAEYERYSEIVAKLDGVASAVAARHFRLLRRANLDTPAEGGSKCQNS